MRDFGAADQVLESLVLNRDRGLDFLQRSFHARDARRQRAVDVQGPGQPSLMDHQSRPAAQVSIVDREERHERRPGGIDRRLATEDEAAAGIELAEVADVFAHHARDFRIAPERRQLRDDEPFGRRHRELLPNAAYIA